MSTPTLVPTLDLDDLIRGLIIRDYTGIAKILKKKYNFHRIDGRVYVWYDKGWTTNIELVKLSISVFLEKTVELCTSYIRWKISSRIGNMKTHDKQLEILSKLKGEETYVEEIMRRIY